MMLKPQPAVPGHYLAGHHQIVAPGRVCCVWCNEPIDETIYVLYQHPFGMHPECAIRSVVGSVGHQLWLCPHFGGDLGDPPGLTRRQAAREAQKLWESKHGAWN